MAFLAGEHKDHKLYVDYAINEKEWSYELKRVSEPKKSRKEETEVSVCRKDGLAGLMVAAAEGFTRLAQTDGENIKTLLDMNRFVTHHLVISGILPKDALARLMSPAELKELNNKLLEIMKQRQN